MSSFPRGATIKSSVTFKTAEGDAIDPSTIRFILISPSGGEVVHDFGQGVVVKDSVGNYHANWSGSESGWWKRRWEGISPSFEAFSDGEIYVRIPATGS